MSFLAVSCRFFFSFLQFSQITAMHKHKKAPRQIFFSSGAFSLHFFILFYFLHFEAAEE